MTRQELKSDDVLARLIARTLQLGAAELDIEYKNGCEEVCAMNGNMGVGIASLDSSGEEASALRKQVIAIGKKGKTITVADADFRVTVATYDSFGETAYRVSIQTKPTSKRGGAG